MKKISTLFLFSTLIVGILSGQNLAVDHWETILFPDNDCKYATGTTAPPTNWRMLNFDDTDWLEGTGPVGYGDEDDNIEIEPTSSLFIRYYFEALDTNLIEEAVLHMDYDDAFVAYINNVEVARANIGIPGVPPAYNQDADGSHEATIYQGGLPEVFSIDKTSLNSTGINVLAIEVHNLSPGSSDLSAIPFLSLGISDSIYYFGGSHEFFYAPLALGASNLPIVVINTNMEVIPDEPKLTATMGIIYNGSGEENLITDPFNDYNGQIGIELRGSSSISFPKKAYSFETRDTSGNNNNVSLLGMPEENDWILYAPYSDKSLMRNVLIYKMGRDMGHYAPRTRYCELIVNGTYQGIYVLMEKIKRDNNRVDIAKLEPTDITGDDLSGGYIFKIDRGEFGWHSNYEAPTVPGFNFFFVYNYPNYDNITEEQIDYIASYVDSFETALNGPDFADPDIGYAKYIDVGSFIDFMIASEISKNIDSYYLSTYLYKDKDSKGGKLTMGPLWDYNLAFGNCDYSGAWKTTGWQYDLFYEDGTPIPFWWSRLLQDPAFKNDLKCRWQSLREDLFSNVTLFDYIDNVADTLEAAQQRNFYTWPIQGDYVWPNYFVGDTYEQDISYLKEWMVDRINWLDDNIPGNCDIVRTEDLIPNFHFNIYPNPGNNFLNIDLIKESTEEIQIKLFDGQGRLVYQTSVNDKVLHIDIASYPPGIYSLNFTNAKGISASKKVVIF